jgi:hypothetical protein
MEVNRDAVYQITWRYILDDSHLRNHHRNNFKSHTLRLCHSTYSFEKPARSFGREFMISRSYLNLRTAKRQSRTQEFDNYFVGCEVLTAVVMKCTIFWDITPCSRLTLNGLHGVISQKNELLTIILFIFVYNFHEYRYPLVKLDSSP